MRDGGTDPVARSDAFDRILEASPEHISLVRVVDQHKVIIRWLEGIVAALCILSGVVTWMAFNARDTAKSAADAAKLASSAQSQNYTTCLAGNDFRNTEKQLWQFILSFPPPAHETAAAKKTRLKQTARFKSYVDKKFAARKCTPPISGPSARGLPFPWVVTPSAVTSSRDTSSTGGSGSMATSAGSSTTPVSRSPSSSPRPSSSSSAQPSPTLTHLPQPTPAPSVCVTADHLAKACISKPFQSQLLGTVSTWPPRKSALTRSTQPSTVANTMKTLAALLVTVCSLLFVRGVTEVRATASAHTTTPTRRSADQHPDQ